jgi:hypothetical protein
MAPLRISILPPDSSSGISLSVGQEWRQRRWTAAAALLAKQHLLDLFAALVDLATMIARLIGENALNLIVVDPLALIGIGDAVGSAMIVSATVAIGRIRRFPIYLHPFQGRRKYSTPSQCLGL